MHEVKQKTILLVEDDATLALAGRRILEGQGYRVIAAQDSKAALEEIVDNLDIDLVLMDLDLGPEMGGAEAARQILKLRELPVVFHSSHTEPEIVAQTEAITSYGYVVKNTGSALLLAGVRNALEQILSSAEKEAVAAVDPS